MRDFTRLAADPVRPAMACGTAHFIYSVWPAILRPAAVALAIGAIVGACTTGMPAANPPRPSGLGDAARPAAVVTPTDAETVAGQAFYQRIEANYLSQGMLRTDAGGHDAPFGASDLAANVQRIAFFDEFSDRGGRLIAGGAEGRLHRWQSPLRLSLEFGSSVPLAQRSRDIADVATYVSRLSRLTGLPIKLTSDNPNFVILVRTPAERRQAGGRIQSFAPGTSPAALRSALELKPDIYCTVFSYSSGRSAVYDRALAMIRAELPDLMRKACFHEEIAQGLGLINDSPRARPSIFNDTEEFALLTRQDELMLRVLYDPRLRPGMTLDAARPIIETIAAELLPGES